jgi:hypothetical protein
VPITWRKLPPHSGRPLAPLLAPVREAIGFANMINRQGCDCDRSFNHRKFRPRRRKARASLALSLAGRRSALVRVSAHALAAEVSVSDSVAPSDRAVCDLALLHGMRDVAALPEKTAGKSPYRKPLVCKVSGRLAVSRNW